MNDNVLESVGVR